VDATTPTDGLRRDRPRHGPSAQLYLIKIATDIDPDQPVSHLQGSTSSDLANLPQHHLGDGNRLAAMADRASGGHL
jgi:hypothetical protein